MLKIVADSAIPFAERFFSCIGDVTVVDAEQINNGTLKDADVFVGRTVTRVDGQLLENTRVKLVASPSSGIDHIDTDYLQENSIHFASAPGSNARSVSEYVLSAMSVLADQKGFVLADKTVGIVGCGHVGSRLREFLLAMEMQCVAYDPFLQEEQGSADFCALSDIQQADIISLHVPLTSEGAYPTRNMLNTQFFQALKDDVILVNTARGGVVDEAALKAFLKDNENAMAVIDTWENEPAIDTELLIRADIATPHIAGYSMDGKLAATDTVFKQVCAGLKLEQQYAQLQAVSAGGDKRHISLNDYDSDIDAISMAVLAAYDVRSDAAALRRLLEDDVADRNSYFTELRNNYPIRREFACLSIDVKKEAEALRGKLLRLGFQLN